MEKKAANKRKLETGEDDDDDDKEHDKQKNKRSRFPSVLSTFKDPVDDALCGVKQCFVSLNQQTMHTIKLCMAIDMGRPVSFLLALCSVPIAPNWTYKMTLARGETTLLGSLATRPTVCTSDVLKWVFDAKSGVHTIPGAIDLEFADASKNMGTALMFAAMSNNFALTKMLIEHGADPNLRCWDVVNNCEGSSTFMLACISGHFSIVAYLLQQTRHIIDMNQRNCHQWTPLHGAVIAKRADVVCELFLNAAHDMDPWIKDAVGKTALDYTTPECPRTKAALLAGLQHVSLVKQLWTYAMNRELDPLLCSVDLCVVLVHQYVWSSS